MSYKGWLSYRRIECLRCEEVRIVGVPCPTCGQEPDEREVDPERQRRQAMADRTLDLLRTPLPPPSQPKLEQPLELWPRLSGLMEGLLGALFAAVEDTQNEPALVAAIQSLAQLEADTAAARRFRPWISTWTAVTDVLGRIRSVTQHYLAAVGADPPIEAQKEARIAQSELDAAGEPARELAGVFERWTSVDAAPSMEQGLGILAQQAFELTDATNIIDFDRAGHHVFTRVTGGTDCPVGLGFGLILIKTQAEGGPFDQDRFWDVASRTFSVLSRAPEWLADLVNGPLWQRDSREAQTKAWDSATLDQGIIAAIRHERQAVRALLEVGKDLVEGPGKRYVATLLAAVKVKQYDTYRNESAGSLLISAAQQQELGPLIEGIDRAVRVASAHDEFELNGDEVILMDRGAEVERISTGELVNRVLAGHESIAAIGLGLLCAAAMVGAELQEILPSVADLGVRAEDVPALFLPGSGWTAIRTVLDGDLLRVEGEVPSTRGMLGHAVTLVPHLSEDVRELALLGTHGSEHRELRGPLFAIREWSSESDGLLKQARYAAILRQWTLDGEPLIDVDQSRKVVANLVIKALQPLTPSTSLPLLRKLLDIARNMNDAQLVESIAGVMARIRDSVTGLGHSVSDTSLHRINEWASSRVKEISF